MIEMHVINIRRDQLKSTSIGIIIVIHLKYRLYLMSFIPIIIYLFIFLRIEVPIIIFSKYTAILLSTQYWDKVYIIYVSQLFIIIKKRLSLR